MTYQQWIDQNYPTAVQAYGACASATLAMVGVFPELRQVKGHYLCPIWGQRAHWWCVTPDGKIVDPTAKQFPSQGTMGEYEEARPGTLIQVGVCMNCGDPIQMIMAEAESGVTPPTFCSDACEKTTLAYLNGGSLR